MTDKIYSKYGELSFKNFFSKFLNTVDFMELDHNFDKFKFDRISNNVQIYLNSFLYFLNSTVIHISIFYIEN